MEKEVLMVQSVTAASAPSNTDLARAAGRHLWHHATQVADYADTGPLMLERGEGALVWDTAGRQYIDGTSILGVTQIGHGRKEIADAIAAQIAKIEYASVANGFSNVPAAELALKLKAITPGKLSATFFACSGSEAVEAALKIARQYHYQQGRKNKTKFIARRGSYHGITLGALSATGITPMRVPFEPLLPRFSHISQPYAYRSEAELGCPPERTGEEAAAALERAILFEGPETVAAFIAEPIALPQAIKVPPDDYWPRVQEICRRYGVLLIADEIFVGWGRTGKLFTSEHWGIEPDILCVSKGLTSGYVPLSAAIVTDEIYQAFWGSAADQLQHGGTYSGHPVSCAAALANIAILERENLVARSAERGAQLIAGLSALAERPFVGNVSGRGLLTSIELVRDRRTKAVASPAVGAFLKARMIELGVLSRYAPNSIYFYPPLVTTEEQIATILTALRQALDDAAKRFKDEWHG